MPGYRERILHVALTEKEGGLNLNMDPEVVNRLTKLGELAGQELKTFNVREHQWRQLTAHRQGGPFASSNHRVITRSRFVQRLRVARGLGQRAGAGAPGSRG